MTVRSAVSVLLALALLAASLPGIQAGRVQHASARLEAAAGDLERVAAALARDNAVVSVDPARTHLTLTLPTRSWGSTGTAAFAITARVGGPDITWRAHRANETTRTLERVTLVAADEVRLETGGRHRLRLELDRRADRRVVVVSRQSRTTDH